MEMSVEDLEADLAETMDILDGDSPADACGDAEGMCGRMADSLRDFLSTPLLEGETVDEEEYFASNTVSADMLNDDCRIAISVKGDKGYCAGFVRLGDLKDFIAGRKGA